jgi:polyadenylate-binding protein 2
MTMAPQEEEEQDVEALKNQLSSVESETERLKQIQSNMMSEQPASAQSEEANELEARKEADERSIFVGNVDYSTSADDLNAFFLSCGSVSRVTIPDDKQGNPKGYAYVEFLEADSVQHALLLHESDFNGRKIKVAPKRTNQPGYKKQRGGRRGRGRAGSMPPQTMDPYFLAMMASQMYGPAAARGGRGRARAPRGSGRGRGRGAPPPYGGAPY